MRNILLKIKVFFKGLKQAYYNIIDIFTKDCKNHNWTYRDTCRYLMEQTLLSIILSLLLIVSIIIMILKFSDVI